MLHIKDLNRLKQVLLVLFEEGLGYYIHKAKLRDQLPLKNKIQPVLPTDKQRQAVRLRRSMERLGPTFVKLGQLLSLRPDLVPEEYAKEFEKLQDSVKPIPYLKVKEIVEKELKKPLKQLFQNFDQQPLAAASIAQVHKAKLLSGREVVVKVQRPNIQKIIDADLDILFYIAGALENHYKNLRNYRPTAVVQEFALWTRRELNFEREAANCNRLREQLKNNQNVKVPRTYPRYTTKKVLTMEFIKGAKITDLQSLKKFHVSRKRVANAYFTSILEQALLHGLFHADPHPANIFVIPSGKLVYLDYGIMGELSALDRKKVIKFITSLDHKEPDKILDIILSLARDTSQADINGFKNEALPLLQKVYHNAVGDVSFANAFYKIIGLGAKYGVIFDPNHVLIAKAIYQAEGIALKLNPRFSVGEGLKEFAKDYLSEEYSPSKTVKRVARTLWDKKELLLELPDHIARIIEKLEKPAPPTQINVSQLHEVERALSNLTKKRNAGLIIASLILASAILFYLEGRTTLIGIPISLLFTSGILITVLYLYVKKEVWKHG